MEQRGLKLDCSRHLSLRPTDSSNMEPLNPERQSLKPGADWAPEGSVCHTQVGVLQGDLIEGHRTFQGVELNFKAKCSNLVPA